ncbi:hypothetical protein [Aquirufa antheringensis]
MKLEEILNQFGLKSQITCKEPNMFFWDDKEYLKYTERDYLNSSTKEVDEVYRMSEFILLNYKTGIRFRVIYSENYFGDELDYKIIEVFVILIDGTYKSVLELNLDKQTINTEGGLVDFSSVLKK